MLSVTRIQLSSADDVLSRFGSYPKYAASILAGNDLFRSTFASVFPLFGTKYFRALGIGGGSSLLAGVSILMIPLLYVCLHRTMVPVAAQY